MTPRESVYRFFRLNEGRIVTRDEVSRATKLSVSSVKAITAKLAKEELITRHSYGGKGSVYFVNKRRKLSE